jgi:hypothetical protein
MLLSPATEVHRRPGSGNAPETRLAEDIALALLGAGGLPDVALADAATWDRTDSPCTVGRRAIETARAALPVPYAVWLDEVVSHGKAGAVSGRYSPDGREIRLFCHVIRFTSASAQEIAQLVSFERIEKRNG